jgi:hypothetical protein
LRRVETQSKRQRLLTPAPFAAYLVGRVREATGFARVAALYTHPGGPYSDLPDVETYPLWAQYYRGPWPVICHPPCGPWGKLKWRCFRQDASLGLLAIAQAHAFGGVVEQPLGSTLFRDYGRPGARVEKVRQGDYGYPCEKWTLLYFVLSE